MGKKRDEVRIDPKLVDFYRTLEKKREMGSDMEDSDSDGDADQTPKGAEWGKTKSHYYNTDYVDADFPTRLDEKQEKQANYEEKEARVIQSRLQATIDYDDINALLGLEEPGNVGQFEDLDAMLSKPIPDEPHIDESVPVVNNKKLKLTNNAKLDIERPDDDPLVKMRREKAEESKKKKSVSREDVQKRPINKAIAKNRGLTPYRKKEYNNPRVRHRNKFKKAQKKRKTMVQEYKHEMSKYSGEATGIKTSTVKSIKFKM